MSVKLAIFFTISTMGLVIHHLEPPFVEYMFFSNYTLSKAKD